MLKNTPYVLFFICVVTSTLSGKSRRIYDSPHATHQHILEELVRTTHGPIIEFGSGDYSTSLLHSLCEKTQRTLITLDDNLKWLHKFTTKFLGKGYEKDNSGWHKFFFVPGKTDNLNSDHWSKFFARSSYINSLHYAICFVDQSPWLARKETINCFKNRSKYVVLHDCNYFPERKIFGVVEIPLDRKIHKEGVFDFRDVFPFFRVYYPAHPWPGNTGPPTLVGSMETNLFPNFED